MPKKGKSKKVHVQQARAEKTYRCLHLVPKKNADGTFVDKPCDKKLMFGGFRNHVKEQHLKGTGVEWDITMLETTAEEVVDDGLVQRVERMERLLTLVAEKLGVAIPQEESEPTEAPTARALEDQEGEEEEEDDEYEDTVDPRQEEDEAAGDDDSSGEKNDDDGEEEAQEAPAIVPAVDAVAPAQPPVVASASPPVPVARKTKRRTTRGAVRARASATFQAHIQAVKNGRK